MTKKLNLSIFNKVFTTNNDQETAVVKLLCEWAVSPERTGEHRALAVAALLDRRQSDTNTPGDQEATPGDDKDSNSSVPGGPPMFQSLLMKFLDTEAPVPAPDDCPMVTTFKFCSKMLISFSFPALITST